MDKEIKILLSVVREAGSAISQMRKNGVDVKLKGNQDIVTQADLHANQLIKSALLTAFPDDGWLSEECVDDAGRLDRRRVWVVDPIDGTREYAGNIPEYAISVALVEHGQVQAGCVYNPETDEMFSAVRGCGAELNGKQIHCKNTNGDKLVLLASRSEFKRGEWDKFKDQDIKIVGSIAYKLALVAAGRADATFSLGPKNEWDIAAGVLLVSEAGGIVTDKTRQPFHFNQKQVLVNGIIASSKHSADSLQTMLDA